MDMNNNQKIKKLNWNLGVTTKTDTSELFFHILLQR